MREREEERSDVNCDLSSDKGSFARDCDIRTSEGKGRSAPCCRVVQKTGRRVIAGGCRDDLKQLVAWENNEHCIPAWSLLLIFILVKVRSV